MSTVESPDGLLRALADARWLTPDRARAYGQVVSIGMLIFTLGLFALFVRGARDDPHGLSYSCDFNAFWSGARLAALGHAGLDYVPAALKAMEETNAQPAPSGGFIAYPYPPVFTLLCLPLAFLPYLLALPVFLGATSAAFAAGVRCLVPSAWPILPIVASPAVLVNAASTQNGCLSATLFTGAMITLERRPAVAGALLGVFAFKPHLALCVPAALLCARRWRALLACGLSAIALCALSYVVLGASAWQGFAESLAFTRAMMQTRPIWGTGQSIYAAARILHAGTPAGLAAQAVAAIFALVCVIRTALARPGGRPEMAVLIAAALLSTPYVMDYDLVCLGAPMAWLAATAVATGWRPLEKWLLAALYIYPLLARTLALREVPIAPFLMAAFLTVLVRRVRKGAVI
jgi:hypothetical protein